MSIDQRKKKKKNQSYNYSLPFPSQTWLLNFQVFKIPSSSNRKTNKKPVVLQISPLLVLSGLFATLWSCFFTSLLLTWGTPFCYTRTHSFQKFLINKLVIIGKEKFKKMSFANCACHYKLIPLLLPIYTKWFQLTKDFSWTNTYEEKPPNLQTQAFVLTKLVTSELHRA